MPDTILLDPLEEKFAAAYRVVLGDDADDATIKDRAHKHAADLRERLPKDLRNAYEDREHWRPAETRAATPIDELVRISHERTLDGVAVEEIAAAIREGET